MADPHCSSRQTTATPRNTSATHEITHYLNVENAKFVAFIMIIGFIAYHGIIHLKYGNDSCKWLLSDGRFPGYSTWQPYGCMTHKYTKSDVRMCMHYISYWGGRNHIAFVGDSRIRQLYFEFMKLVSTTDIPERKVHNDLHYDDDQISARVDFLWQPMVNTSMYYVYKSWLMSGPTARPNLIVTGSGTWSIKLNNASEQALKNFEVNLTMIVPYLNKLKNTATILWMLQDPVNEEKLSVNRSMITNQQIDDYNKVAIQILDNSAASIWSSSRLVGQGLKKESVDGLHIPSSALELDAQILFNMYCNNHMNYNDGTCCRSPDPVSTLQLITAATFLVIIISAIALWIYRRRKTRRNGVKARAENGPRNGQTNSQNNSSDGCQEIVNHLAKLGIIMFYFYLCDRTNFFMKENKYYTHVNFFLPFAYVMILGFFFTEPTEQTSVLHRDQTDEWKGWMQLIILIYHFTGASQVLPIYMHIRVLVSSYLFLSGYGHFTYFWQKGEYGLFRYCQRGCCHISLYWHTRKKSIHRLLEVLFRLNCFVFTLCFVMDRAYQFYYFVPLVSFWYIVVYITMAAWPHVSKLTVESNFHYLYMVSKFILLAVFITLFYLSEVFFEKVFLSRPFKALFVTSDDSIREWRFRWQLDRYSTLYGMLFAFGYQLLIKYRIIDDTTRDTLFSKGASWLLCIFSILGITGYTVFACVCRTKPHCNDVHSYLTFLPIISYIILRNVPGWLRTKYSTFFAWFGKISLELFIAQYHIWLASDTHGILVLVPGYPVLNVVITSYILVCICHEIHCITTGLVKYAVPSDWKMLLRNIVLFVAILLPVSIKEGALVL
ncbi:N-acetylneuraminate 9-O-acetyltransferase-like isoform X1 [Octopus sinensis]|uniref:N-acetylneuraminate 9-O-acetyltransferase-like isoform X1 n=1 Tax=Octopus sinensis TaxID=2607531 RepID=A0A6P7TDT7_9MOLL|nr:N-acetylneuraminate 9-O-acetyltransferase-like isoform X1 [Octopus sinensis]